MNPITIRLSRISRSSRTHHPDRRSSTSSDTDSNQTFILIRKAYETLTNPTHRYAYDRFGPDIVDWFPDSSPSSSSSSYGSGGSGSGSGSGKGEVGLGEYMKVGLMRSGGFYLVSGGIMGLLACA
jgi:DnaJ-class molecular chaperone